MKDMLANLPQYQEQREKVLLGHELLFPEEASNSFSSRYT